MFERFTDRARRVVVLAQEEARMLKHQTFGPEIGSAAQQCQAADAHCTYHQRFAAPAIG